MPRWIEMWMRFSVFMDSKAVIETVFNSFPPVFVLNARTLQALETNKRSVDLWGCLLQKTEEEVVGEEKVREVMEKAVSSAGREWSSAPLWRAYFAFEAGKGRVVPAARLYIRALKAPIQGHQELLMELQEHLVRHYPEQLVFLMQNAKETAGKLVGEVEERALYERQVSDNFTGKVEEEEKAAWGEYVDRMETKNSPADLRSLLERYLARCHATPDAWIRYATWLVSQPTEENIRQMQKQMVESRTYLGLNARVFLHWAELEEDLGLMNTADKIIELVGKQYPAMRIDMTVRRANLAQRLKDKLTACQRFEEALDMAWRESAVKGTQVAARYSTYLLVTGHEKKGRQVQCSACALCSLLCTSTCSAVYVCVFRFVFVYLIRTRRSRSTLTLRRS